MIYRFDDVTLDTDAVSISRDGRTHPCEPKAFALLQYLIENRERVVSKDELIDRIWNLRVVSDNALHSCVNAARRAVGDDGRSQRFIRTLPKRGFRFAAEVTITEHHGAGPHANVPGSPPSIAVMPFRNLSTDPEQDFVADAMMEDLVMTLSRIRWLVVIGSGTMITYRGQHPQPGQVSSDLDVRYMLSGSLRRSGNRLRVSAQLFDCIEHRAIWADMYDRNAKDIFDVQDDITAQVASTVEHELARAEQIRADRTKPENLDAWQAYQKGILRIRSGAAARDLSAIKDLFELSIELDPGFALAHAARAFVEYWGFVEGLGGADRETAFASAHKAVELDPLEPFAHQALASLYWSEARYQSSIDASNRALELNPSFAWAHHLLGITNITLGATDLARASMERAIRLSPRDTLIGIFYAGVSLCHLVEKNYPACIAWARRALAYPQPRWVHTYLLSALGHTGDQQEAREIRTLISRVRPEFCLEYIERNFPILLGASRSHYLQGLRLAGLRET